MAIGEDELNMPDCNMHVWEVLFIYAVSQKTRHTCLIWSVWTDYDYGRHVTEYWDNKTDQTLQNKY